MFKLLYCFCLFVVAFQALITPVMSFDTPAHVQRASTETVCNITTPYPDKCQITNIFSNLGNEETFGAFYGYVAPNVSWTLMGTHALAGHYTNLAIFVNDTVIRLASTLDRSKPSSFNLVHVTGGGDEEWSVEELHATGVAKNGLIYDNRFSWVTRWNTNGIIVEVRAYFDSAQVQRIITENESGVHKYTDERRTFMSGPTGINCLAAI